MSKTIFGGSIVPLSGSIRGYDYAEWDGSSKNSESEEADAKEASGSNIGNEKRVKL